MPSLAPDDVVVMDNLSSHKVPGVRKAIEALGAKLLYPPPYSPDFNPLEQLFAKLKDSARPANAPSPACGTASANSSRPSRLQSAQSAIADMLRNK